LNPFREKQARRLVADLAPGDEVGVHYIVRGFAPGCPLEEDRYTQGTVVAEPDFNVRVRDNLGVVYPIPVFWVTGVDHL
jgi:hypothetical protein